MAVYASVTDLIGNTPIVDISALSPNPRVKIYCKLEGQNPGGSVKDRAAKSMIEDAEREGLLQPGSVVLESSSGNTGIALAMICKMRGYTFKVVMPENVSVERRQALEIWGAEIIPSPASEGSNGAMVRAKAMAAEHPDWWFPFQYGNDANPRAHYEGTGPEIWKDLPEVTHFIAGLGTAGTLMGVGTYLKEQNPDIQVWAIEPPPGEMVDGLKNIDEGFVPPVFSDWDGYDLLDRKMIVHPRIHRVDPQAHRRRPLRGHLVGGDHGRRGEVRGCHRRRRDRHHRLRRRLEVPQHRRLDRAHRRGRRPGQEDHLLLATSHPGPTRAAT